jgi:bifunctional DNA primase/polymerase-like protein
MLEQALEYAKRGWPVFPCVGKRPAIASGFYSATTDPVTTEARWVEYPTANIATPTGNTTAVLDIDGPAGVDAIRHAGISFTSPGPIAKTPRGWHYYIQSVGPTRIGVLDKVDWKDRGGYVIVPPSRSLDGVPYYWIDGHGPDRPIPCYPTRSGNSSNRPRQFPPRSYVASRTSACTSIARSKTKPPPSGPPPSADVTGNSTNRRSSSDGSPPTAPATRT